MNVDVAAEVSASKKFFKSQLSLSVPMSCRTLARLSHHFVQKTRLV
jgi:hypothetical protein